MNQIIGTRLKMWAVIIGVFVLGGVTGASLDSVYHARRGGGERHGGRERRGDKGHFFERMRRDLNLNDEQALQVRAILDETRDEVDKLQGEARPRFDAIRDASRARIRAVLTPDQQKIFDAKAAERDARHKRRERSEP